MKIIDSKGRLFEKVSIIDIMIIAVVVAGIIFMMTFLFKQEASIDLAENQQKISYQIEVLNVPEAFTKMPQPGGPVYNSSKSYHIGELVGVEVMPFEETAENYDEGTIEAVEAEDLYTVLLTIEAVAEVNDFEINVGQQEVRIGESVPVKGKGFAGYGYIVGIDLEGQAN